VRHQSAVTRLLDPLYGDGFPDDRIGDGLREGRDHAAGAMFDRARVAPEREGAQALEQSAVELRPGERLGLEADVRFDERPAEQVPML